jgi:hypothetical protein
MHSEGDMMGGGFDRFCPSWLTVDGEAKSTLVLRNDGSFICWLHPSFLYAWYCLTFGNRDHLDSKNYSRKPQLEVEPIQVDRVRNSRFSQRRITQS